VVRSVILAFNVYFSSNFVAVRLSGIFIDSQDGIWIKSQLAFSGPVHKCTPASQAVFGPHCCNNPFQQ
jgi:hypothetical protein